MGPPLKVVHFDRCYRSDRVPLFCTVPRAQVPCGGHWCSLWTGFLFGACSQSNIGASLYESSTCECSGLLMHTCSTIISGSLHNKLMNGSAICQVISVLFSLSLCLVNWIRSVQPECRQTTRIDFSKLERDEKTIQFTGQSWMESQLV